ncbi:MAG: hypothetical protein CL489_06955 [Acidobacteria bacterium]|nr:hypothetical protein [Acidobacteriota bacterium]
MTNYEDPRGLRPEEIELYRRQMANPFKELMRENAADAWDMFKQGATNIPGTVLDAMRACWDAWALIVLVLLMPVLWIPVALWQVTKGRKGVHESWARHAEKNLPWWDCIGEEE